MSPSTLPSQHHFLVSGEVEYTETSEHGPTTRTMKVSGVFASEDIRVGAKALGDLQIKLQQAFHQRYSRTHPVAPDITYATLEAISYLGQMTEEEFLAGLPEQP